MRIEYVTVEPKYAEALVELEAIAFPTAARDELLSLAGVAMQCKMFPEGGFVAVDRDADDAVAGFAMGCYVDFDLEHPQHHIDEVVGTFGSDNHDPNGAWYYGTDIAVSADYRRQGIGKKLYDLRKDLMRRDNRIGMVAGGVIPGFSEHKHEMSADEYVTKVRDGQLYDATLTMQLENGFEVHGAIADYWTDEVVDSWASLIVWWNPDHDPVAFAAAKAEDG